MSSNEDIHHLHVKSVEAYSNAELKKTFSSVQHSLKFDRSQSQLTVMNLDSPEAPRRRVTTRKQSR